MKNQKLPDDKFSGFKVPEHYLETFDETLLNRLKGIDTLKEVQKSGFQVPDAYFATFDNKITEAISSEKEVKVISLNSWKKVAYISGIAASIIFMVSLFIPKEEKLSMSNLETTMIVDYIVEEDFTNEDFVSLLTEDVTLNNFMDSHLIDSNLEDYIIDNISIEDYLNE